jgi:hypothetical protein
VPTAIELPGYEPPPKRFNAQKSLYGPATGAFLHRNRTIDDYRFLSEMQDKAMKCRKTCKICCEGGGGADGDCYDKGSNCGVNQALCNNSVGLD